MSDNLWVTIKPETEHVETTITFLVFEVQRQDADHPEPNLRKISNNVMSNNIVEIDIN